MEPNGQEAPELREYLNNTLCLEVASEKIKDERALYHKNGIWTFQTKYLTVNVVKKRNNNNYLQRKIKVVLVDHHASDGIPYKNKIQGEEPEDDEDPGLQHQGTLDKKELDAGLETRPRRSNSIEARK